MYLSKYYETFNNKYIYIGIYTENEYPYTIYIAAGVLTKYS